MAPAKIRVKLVSEAAEYVSVSHVVQRDFNLMELVELILPVVGKDPSRIRQMLHVGTVSTGEYRYRWQGLEIEAGELQTLLETFPGPEPLRAFEPEKCIAVRFRRGLETLDLPQESASRKPLFARQSFWDALLVLATKGARYASYSYADKADVFSLALDTEGDESLRALLPLLKPKSAADRLERLRPERIELLTHR